MAFFNLVTQELTIKCIDKLLWLRFIYRRNFLMTKKLYNEKAKSTKSFSAGDQLESIKFQGLVSFDKVSKLDKRLPYYLKH